MNAASYGRESTRVFDAVVVVAMGGLILGSYVDAYAHVKVPGRVIRDAATAGQTCIAACWLVLTAVLLWWFARGLRRGRTWNAALPDGYTGSLVAALVFGAALIADSYFWPLAAPNAPLGLDALFTPPHIVEIGAAAVIVSGPLRAAARRGETAATPITLVSAALLLSVLTFATQFLHPLIDPWSATAPMQVPAAVPLWVAQNLGVSAILVQASLLAGTGLLLYSVFRLPFGSLTLVFAINGLLVTITKTHYYLLPVPLVTGVAADLFLAWTARRAGRPSASLTCVIGGTFALAYMLDIQLTDGSRWAPSLWSGVIIATATLTWIMGRLLRAGSPSVPEPPLLQAVGFPADVRWTRDPQSMIRPQLVRAALDDLGTPEALGRSPLTQLAGLSRGGSAAADLRAALVDVIAELAAAPAPRDSEAGRLLLDYYVKRVGSHEVIMERLHLSRPTFYRRLQLGFGLVAERLDELSEFAQDVPINK